MKSKPILRLGAVISVWFGLISAARSDTAGVLEFESIHMVDRGNGWAQNLRSVLGTNGLVFKDKCVWRTRDGGKSWREVLRTSPAERGCVSGYFRDAKTAWVAATDEDSNHVTIFRTRNGGASWAHSEIHLTYPYYCNLSVSGTGEGWLMISPEGTMNSSTGDLYRSDREGAHWRAVNSTTASPREWIWENAEEPEFKERHPYLICGGLVAFKSATIGWERGSLASTAPEYLFTTRDGGRNWQAQDLAMPATVAGGGRMEPRGLPKFFGAKSKEGIMAAEYCPADAAARDFSVVFYRTHDGGLKWEPTTPVKFSGTWDFITADKGWVWSAEPHNTGSTQPVKGMVYRTQDGGVSWKATSAEAGLEQFLTHGGDIAQLDFVDAKHGWAIARDLHDFTRLLQTSDGGETWQAIDALAR